MAAPYLYKAWVAASMVLVPFAARREINKLRRAGVDVDRAHEKLGHATAPREGLGPLIWFHGASVGESLSVLSLITRMGQMLPRAQFLMTSGTATSAALVGQRLPPRTVHQFAPLDAPGPVGRFLNHWRPDAAIFVESELWPQMLRRTHERGARMALVNARLSKRSIAGWRKRPALARYIFDVFDLILTQNDAMAEAMVSIHAPAPRVARGQNLKSMSAPLPVDGSALQEARQALAGRPIWVASSTHAGEEAIVLEAHNLLLKDHPDLCLILVPRHPERSKEVVQVIADKRLPLTRRSAGEMPTAPVYLADTLGELGVWYALSDVVFLGGSLMPKGGHNPFEVAQAGAAVLSGNHVFNFAETYAEMEAAGAARIVADAEDIARQLDHLLRHPEDRARMIAGAGSFIAAQTDALDSIASRLIKALELAG